MLRILLYSEMSSYVVPDISLLNLRLFIAARHSKLEFSNEFLIKGTFFLRIILLFHLKRNSKHFAGEKASHTFKFQFVFAH